MSRILDQKYEIVPIDQLKPHPQNARRGNTAGICESIHENGFFGAVYVQRSSGHILAGKHRWDSAKREGLSEIPVIWLEVSDAQARKILSADNALSDQATYNDLALADLLTEISAESGLLGSGFDQAGFDALVAQLGNEALGIAEAHLDANREADAAGERGDNAGDVASSGEEPNGARQPEPKGLLELLVQRPTWNKKRTIRFLSLRKWNSDRKTAGIEAFKAAKKEQDCAIVDAAANEIAGALREFLHNPSGLVFTAPPSGASAGSGNEWHFGTILAKTVASHLGGEFRTMFAERPRKGGSHPRSFDKRGSAELIEGVQIAGAFIVLVDDIASSATTLEECGAALRDAGASGVLAISWLYEEAEERPEAA